MKTIQLSTTRKLADIQVIEVNSKFTIKAFKALEAIKSIDDMVISQNIGVVYDFLNELIDALEENDNKQEGE